MRSGKRKITNIAQTSLEYAVVIAVIVAALLAMQAYIKRGFMGRLKGVADELGQQYDYNNTSGTHNLFYLTNATTIVQTKNEIQLGFNLTTGLPVNLSADVFGSETNSTLNNSTVNEAFNETTSR